MIILIVTVSVAGGERPRNRDTKEVGEQSSFESTTENHFSQVKLLFKLRVFSISIIAEVIIEMRVL